MSTALVWFRRDLRLADNPALHAACAQHQRVVPVFVWAPDEEAPWQPGAASRWWLHHSLQALSKSLSAIGAPLTIRAGDTLAELRKLLAETGASAVYWNRLYEPALIARDQHIQQALRADGHAAESHNSALLFEPWELKTQGGEPYRVFTPFWRKAQAHLPPRPPLPTPAALTPAEHPPVSLPLSKLGLLPKLNWADGFRSHWQPGEAGAWNRLRLFCESALTSYKERRDLPAVSATSSLSPHLHFGEIGPVQLAARLRQFSAEQPAPGVHGNVEHYLRELGWREFAHHLLYHYPHTPQSPMYRDKFGRFPWRQPQDYATDLRAWQKGETGIPIVDAGMRQLWSSGWMHNRVRMIVASLLTKNLLIPWQEGACWFWDTLVDASLANNTLGWQWTAGCGADAAPYFRIFNPSLQSARFDPEGVYLRRWLPALAELSDDEVHTPWNASPEARIRLEGYYAAPIVDLPASRERALAAYAEMK